MRRTFSVGFGVAVLAAVAGVSHGQQAVQWRVQDGGNGHWYGRIVGSFTWIAARDACVQRGGYLATPTSAAENAVAHSVNQGNCWIGGFQPPNTCEPYCGWQWVTGEPWVYTNWDPPNQPDDFEGQDHLIYWTGNRWGDIQGSVTESCICEWSADCDGNGVVDYGEILDGTLEDTNTNGVPDCCDEGTSCEPCAGDINNDNRTDGADISVLLGFWGQTGKSVLGDIDGNHVVDAADLSALLASWGPCP